MCGWAHFHFTQRSPGLPHVVSANFRGCFPLSTSAAWSLVGGSCGCLWTRHHRIALIGYKHLFFQADRATAMAVSVIGWLVLWNASAPGSTYTPPPPELGRVPRGAPKDHNSFWLCPLLGTPVTSTSGGHDWLLKLQVSPCS